MASPLPDFNSYRLLPLSARSLPDKRDYLSRFTAAVALQNPIEAIKAGQLPSRVNLHELGLISDVWDQGQEGSCTGHGLAAAVDNAYRILGTILPERPSPRFIYWLERVLEGTTGQDAGALPRDGYEALRTQGVCLESDCPYVPGDFAQAPSAQAYANAGTRLIDRYESLPGWQWITYTLGAEKRFVNATSYWYPQWNYPEGGVLSFITPGTQPSGGHDYGYCGYDFYQEGSTQVLDLTLHNSWSKLWCQDGHAKVRAEWTDQWQWERWACYAPSVPAVASVETVGTMTLTPSIDTLVIRKQQPIDVTGFLGEEFQRFAALLKRAGVDVQGLLSRI